MSHIYLLASYVGILHKSQGRLEAFKLSHRIGLSHKLLDQSQVFAPLWTLLIVNPLVQAQSLLITTQTGFPHLVREKTLMRKEGSMCEQLHDEQT